MKSGVYSIHLLKVLRNRRLEFCAVVAEFVKSCHLPKEVARTSCSKRLFLRVLMRMGASHEAE